MKSDILTIGPNNGLKIYKSVRAASRALSGNGSDSLKSTIHNRIVNGGGYVGNTWIQSTKFPGTEL